MKAMRWILTMVLALAVGAPMAFAQDDAYLTPSKAKALREQQAKERAEAQKRLDEKRAAAAAEQAKARAAAEARANEYAEDVSDWYNRRPMQVTIEEMESNLAELDGTQGTYREESPRRSNLKGGEYSQRLRKYGKNSDVIVLQNVDRVYVVDGFDYYDPWSNSYYGRDWDSGVNIMVNIGPYWGWNRPYYDRWYYNRWYTPWYVSWSYPWYDRWYDPWYDPWYSPRYSWGWGWSRPWGRPYYGGYGYWGGYYGGYYSNYYSYWDGYYDGRRHDRYDRWRNAPRSTYGRSTGGYYDRSAHNATYGRALGNSSRTTDTRAGYYDRTTRTLGGNDFGYDTNTRTRSNDRTYRVNTGNTTNSRWDRSGNTTRRSTTVSSPSRSTTRNSGASIGSSSPSRSSSGSSGTTRTTTGRRTR